MAIFSGRRVHPHLSRVLNRALDDPNISQDQKENIAEALASGHVMDVLSGQVAKLAKDGGAPVPPPDPAPPSTHPFLTWLLANLPAIIAMIISIFAGGA